MNAIDRTQLTVLLLAGGQGSRLGGRDKGLMPWQGQPIAKHLVDMVRPLACEVIISCNRHHQIYQDWADRIVSDQQADYPGPLVGILAGLAECNTSHLLVIPCDLPHLDQTLLLQLLEQVASQPSMPWLIKASEAWQPLVSVIPQHLLADLQHAWSEGQRSPLRWFLGQIHGVFPVPAYDPRLHNANHPEDWQQAT